jgi:hypothetical protein
VLLLRVADAAQSQRILLPAPKSKTRNQAPESGAKVAMQDELKFFQLS